MDDGGAEGESEEQDASRVAFCVSHIFFQLEICCGIPTGDSAEPRVVRDLFCGPNFRLNALNHSRFSVVDFFPAALHQRRASRHI